MLDICETANGDVTGDDCVPGDATDGKREPENVIGHLLSLKRVVNFLALRQFRNPSPSQIRSLKGRREAVSRIELFPDTGRQLFRGAFSRLWFQK